MDVLTTIVSWLTPTVLGTAIAWLVNTKLRRTREVKEHHDAYQEMYDDVSEELINMRNENEKLYKAIRRLERAISMASGCDYWDHCPICDKLHNDQEGIISGKATTK